MADDVEPLPLGGDDSPWAHNIPIGPPSPLPAAWSNPADRADERDRPRPDRPGGASPPDPHRSIPPDRHRASPPDPHLPSPPDPHLPSPPERRRWVVVGSVAVGLLAAAFVTAQLVGGGADRSGADEAAELDAVTSDEPRPDDRNDDADDRNDDSDDRNDDTDNDDTDTDTAVASPATRRPSRRAVVTLPQPEPQWTTRQIEVADRFAAMTAATEVVFRKRDGTLHVLALPSGVLHSIDTGQTPNYSMMIAGSDAIVLSPFDARDPIRIFTVDARPIDVEPPEAPAQVTARVGTDSFVVTPTYWSGDRPPTYTLTEDGSVGQVIEGPLAEVEPWRIRFLPTTGELLITDAGGTYAIDDSGVARRISSGDLVAVGSRHFVVRVCDEMLICGYERVDAQTAETQPALLTELDGYPPLDSNTSLSPDGTKLVYLAYQTDQPTRRIIDLTTGTSLAIDETEQSLANSMWAADSSGLFVVEGGYLVLFDASTGASTAVSADDALTNVADVATRDAPD